jgi:hypothetical protein
MHCSDAVPVSHRAGSSVWATGAGSGVDLLSGPQEVDVAAGAAVCRGCEANRAVKVVLVGPGHECVDPRSRVAERPKWSLWVARSVFEGPEQRFRVGVVVADAWTAERVRHAQLLQRREHRCALHRRAVVGVQRQLSSHDPLALAGIAYERGGQLYVFVGVDSRGHHLATEHVHDEVEVEELANKPFSKMCY